MGVIQALRFQSSKRPKIQIPWAKWSPQIPGQETRYSGATRSARISGQAAETGDSQNYRNATGPYSVRMMAFIIPTEKNFARARDKAASHSF